MVEEGDDDDFEDIEPELKEQDKGIIEAFARAEHRVVLSNELEEFVNISERQLRRRLDDLVTREIVGTRKPGRDRLWWLKDDVKEPITVQYPMLRLVRDSPPIQLTIGAVVLAVVGAIITTSATSAMAYETNPPVISTETLLFYGLGASVLSASLLAGAVIALGINRLLLR